MLLGNKKFTRMDNSVYIELIDRIDETNNIYNQQLEHFTKSYGLQQKNIKGNTSINSLNNKFYSFDDEKGGYEFSIFSKISFGKSVAISEEYCLKISQAQFYYSKFIGCCFSNIVFENCDFVGCEFNECYTNGIGVIFNNCNFSKPEFKGNGPIELENIVNVSVIFKNIKGFSMKVRNCAMYNMISVDSSFLLTEFENTDLSNSIFYRSPYLSLMLKGCNLNDSKVVIPEYIELCIEDTNKHTKVNEGTYLSNIKYKLKKEENKDIKNIKNINEKSQVLYKTYVQLAEQFKSNNIMELYGEYFYLSKRVKHKMIENKPEKLISTLSLISCGYGERPYYSLISSVFIIVISAILYMFSGVDVSNGKLINYDIVGGVPVSITIIIRDLIRCIHFSLVTFTTVGYGNVVPYGTSLIISSFEIILGVIMIAIWTSTLVRKMTR